LNYSICSLHIPPQLCIFRNKPFQTQGCKCTRVEECFLSRAWVAAQPAVGGQNIAAQLVYFSIWAQECEGYCSRSFCLNKLLIMMGDWQHQLKGCSISTTQASDKRRSALLSAFSFKFELKANITYESIWNCCVTTKHKTNQAANTQYHTDKNNVPEPWTNRECELPEGKLHNNRSIEEERKKNWIMKTQFYI